MDVEARAEDFTVASENRRAAPRLPVEGEATLLVLKHDCRVPCRITDLSIGGCRIETQKEFRTGIQTRVEVSFKVHGLLFRFNGITQWTDGRRLVGIRFVDVTSRRKDELAELLCEVEQENAEKAAEQLALEAAVESQEAEEPGVNAEQSRPVFAVEALPAPSASCDPSGSPAHESHVERGLPSVGSTPANVAHPPVIAPPAKPVNRERRTQSRHQVDTSAVIHLINVRSIQHGRILDLSVGGCRIRTLERFPVGIYTRVETEFRIEGLPFRLGGVIQAVHDRFNVGIRFLDLSDRKRGQVEQLIEEIQQMRENQKPAGSPDSTGETREA